MAKIHLDPQLIASARRITTGANIHHIKQLIFVYEQAVSLHNSGWPTHRVYQLEHETALRQLVAKELQLRSRQTTEAGCELVEWNGTNRPTSLIHGATESSGEAITET